MSINVDKIQNSATEEEPPIIKRVADLSTAPSLRGRMIVEENVHKCQGVWAMTDKSHSIPGQTSDFEFKLVLPSRDPVDAPVNGRYYGWFMIKHPQKNTTTRIEDRDLDITFTKKEDSNDYNVTGSGLNKFGKFTLQGTLKPNMIIQLYKIYQPRKAPVQTPRGSIGGSPRPRNSPRESSSRKRRPSLALAESQQAHKEKKVPKIPSQKNKQAQRAASSESNVVSSRVSRPPPFVAKCKEVLKDIKKQVSSIYFAEPVDHVKLGIPDYPSIVKEPMDFGTISANLEKNYYKSHEMFAEHMRLVFRNAIKYNVRRDNPVHIAARELSDMFEEKYRAMVSQLGSNVYLDDAGPLPRQPNTSGGRKSVGGKSRGRVSQHSAGPRPMEAAVPPAMDGSMQQMMLMHQKMLDMEQELNSLRTAVRQTEIRNSLDQQRVAAQIPLSYDEKKALIENIQKLDGEQITAVVDIIQSAMPATDCGGDGDEVEIPMDELDTYTLRQLQDYVHSVQQQTINAKRKRQSSSSQRSPRGKKPKPSSLVADPVHDIPAPTSYDNLNGNHDGGDSDADSRSRKRSNSLDLFPSDEMEQDPVVTGAGNDLMHNGDRDAWTSKKEDQASSSHANSGSESWESAVTERKDSLHRESEIKAESEKLSELRAKTENTRMNAYENQSAHLAKEEAGRLAQEQNKDAELSAQRELERSKRAEMSRTVELHANHDALYCESLDL